MLIVERIVSFCAGALALLKDVIHRRSARARDSRKVSERTPRGRALAPPRAIRQNCGKTGRSRP